MTTYQYWRMVGGQAFGAWWEWVWGNVVIGVLLSVGVFAATWLVHRSLKVHWPSIAQKMEGPLDNPSSLAVGVVVGAVALGLVLFGVLLSFLLSTPAQLHSKQADGLAKSSEKIGDLEQLVASRGPQLSGEIRALESMDSPGTIPMPKGLKPGVVVLFNMIVRNSGGKQSIAEEWRTTVKTPDNRTVPGVSVVYDPGIAIRLGEFTIGKVPTMKYYAKEDLIHVKAMSPIEPGDGIVGTYSAHFPGLDHKEVLAVGTEYAIQFQDIDGRVSTVQFTSTGEEPEYGWHHTFPGDKFMSDSQPPDSVLSPEELDARSQSQRVNSPANLGKPASEPTNDPK